MILGSYISFNVKTSVQLKGLSDEKGKEVCKNVQVRFIDSCRFINKLID